MALYDPERLRCDQTAAWAALQTHFYGTGRDFDLRDAFASDPGRFAAFSQSAPYMFADLSINLLDTATEQTLLDLAQEDFTDQRSLSEAKQLMRTLIAHYTGGKELESRKIFKELQEP